MVMFLLSTNALLDNGITLDRKDYINQSTATHLAAVEGDAAVLNALDLASRRNHADAMLTLLAERIKILEEVDFVYCSRQR